MSDVNSPEVLSAEEQQYYSKKNLLDSMCCMTPTEEKVKIYQALAKDFAALGDVLDAKVLAKQCEQHANDTIKTVKEAQLKRAEELLQNVKAADDLDKADKLLTEIGEYKNAEELKAQCKLAYDKLAAKRRHKIYTFYGVILLIIGLFIFSRTHLGQYELGKICNSLGADKIASDIFAKLDDYKDSNQLMKECNYDYGKSILAGDNNEIQDYNDAKIAFINADGYKDSLQLIAEVEQKRFACKEVGDLIRFGDYNWVIAEKADHKALAVKVDGVEELPYSETLGNVTWETSSLREYLNTTFLNDNFTKEQQAYVLDTNLTNPGNSTYNIAGGNDTVDKIFILSAEEQLKYEKVLNKHGNNSWLRTPGATSDSVSFITSKGQIMEYGYQADSTNLFTVPAFWYQY